MAAILDDPQARASYEHRKLLLQLSNKLSKDDSKNIVYLEVLPQELNDIPDPLKVLTHLELRGKTTPKELIRILSSIGRQDAAKFIAKSKKTSQTRKRSGTVAPRLASSPVEDTLTLIMKNCEVLLEHIEFLLTHAVSKGNKRIEEVVSEAKRNLTDVVQRKLKYAASFLILNSKSQSELCDYMSPSDGPPFSPMHQGPLISVSDLKRSYEKLQPQGVVIQKGKDCNHCNSVCI